MKTIKTLSSNESGRTMLEMIGVLGIMGVIMYGAISGINYGMSTYKINQTYSDVQDIIRNVEDLYSWSRSYGLTEVMMSAGCENDIFPTSQNCSSGAACCVGGCQVFNQFGGCIQLERKDSGASFLIRYTAVPQDACNRLKEMEWTNIGQTFPDECATSNEITFFPI